MNKRPFIANAGHPEPDDLLRYADGELAAAETRDVRAHLEACWPCRTELEQLESSVKDCVRYRKTLAAVLPTPPAPWRDLRPMFDSVDAEIEHPSLWSRFVSALRAPLASPLRWAPAALALLLVGVLIYRMQDAPAVSAAVLLRDAVAASEARKPVARRLEVRARGSVVSQPADLARVGGLFQQAGYDWSEPVSARSYSAWRGHLASKRDEVVRAGANYEVRTFTEASSLREASLQLRVENLEPVAGNFRFQSEQVEIRDLGPATEPAISQAAPAAPAVAIDAPATAPAVETPVAPVTPAEELRVLAALQKLGADLGDPVEVRNTGKELVVSGVGVDAQRQQQIRDALASQPRVAVRFDEPGAVPASAGSQTRVAPFAATSPVQAQLEKHFGGRALLDQFSDRAFAATESVLARAHALRRLGDRFPQAAEVSLADGDRALLASLRQEHAAALARQASELRQLLKPVLTAIGAESGQASAAPPQSWQADAAHVLETAKQVERMLAAVLGGTDGSTPAQLAQAIAQLEAETSVQR